MHEAVRLRGLVRERERSDRAARGEGAANAVGLGRPETLHRAFSRRVGTTPDRYRQHHAHPTTTGATP